MSLTKQINMSHVTKWDRLRLCRKSEKASVRFCGVHTASDIEIENIVIGFYELPDHITHFFLLINSSLCNGTDSGKRKIENKS
jgi:hypothetical protein